MKPRSEEIILSDRRIKKYSKLVTPAQLKEKLPLTEKAAQNVWKSRRTIENILDGLDHRKLIIVGPCSIHNKDGALEYAKRLKELSKEVDDKLLLVMRTYFEKPRTIMGWKGLIYDPDIDGTNEINSGLYLSRELLLAIVELGIPTATEFLGIWTPQYIDDVVSYAAIGARTCESQPHREMASGLSMAVGFKNTTNGDYAVAVQAAKAAQNEHLFVGIDEHANGSLVQTIGNPYSHIILRGGNGDPNHKPELVQETAELMNGYGMRPNIVIDCSHGNSNKVWEKQPEIFCEVIDQIVGGNNDIVGVMVESYLSGGNQEWEYGVTDPSTLSPYKSITDGCIGWETTENLILKAHELMLRI